MGKLVALNEKGYYCMRDHKPVVWQKAKPVCRKKIKCKSLRVYHKGVLVKPKKLWAAEKKG